MSTTCPSYKFEVYLQDLMLFCDSCDLGYHMVELSNIVLRNKMYRIKVVHASHAPM